MKIKEIADYLNDLLGINDIPDVSLNGIQVETGQDIRKIAVAVDANLETFKKAKAIGAGLLIVHHGLFWGKEYPLTGVHFDRIRFLIENQVGLIAVHLPLDIHSEYGNNVQILNRLGLQFEKQFHLYHGVLLGFLGTFQAPLLIGDVEGMIRDRLGIDPVSFLFGRKQIQRVAVISGGAPSAAYADAIAEGADLLIVGEASHETYSFMEDNRMNVISLGHYLSESFGIQALGNHLAAVFHLEQEFVSHPTGL